MTIKSIPAILLFQRHPEIEAKLWGGKFWTSGFYENTVGKYGNEGVIKKYIENQEMQKAYKKIFDGQLTLDF
jgi:REP element-mobilizing transposase RayT